MTNEVRLNLTEDEHIRLLEVLSEANETKLAVDVNQAWLKGFEQKVAPVEVLAKLQLIRGYLFGVKGYLEATGFPGMPLSWIAEAIKAVKSLQKKLLS